MPQSGIPLSEWSGSGATRELHETMKKQIEANDKQFRKSIFWGRIAGIGAIVGIVLMIVQILLSIYQGKPSERHNTPQVQLPMQDNQQPTKNKASASSSHIGQGNRINSKKSSTYNAPSQTNK